MRKSGYLASVLELRPVSCCHESSLRSCRSSSERLNRSSGLARYGNLFRALLLSLGLGTAEFLTILPSID